MFDPLIIASLVAIFVFVTYVVGIIVGSDEQREYDALDDLYAEEAPTT
jgi:hypothetical protein